MRHLAIVDKRSNRIEYRILLILDLEGKSEEGRYVCELQTGTASERNFNFISLSAYSVQSIFNQFIVYKRIHHGLNKA